MAQKTIFLFLDGVGIGGDSHENPFYFLRSLHLPFYLSGMALPDGTPVKPIDSRAGLPGTPQSATCQTALFTGSRGRELGREHAQGYPTRRLRRLLAKSNLFSMLEMHGCKCRFLNAYPFHGSHFTSGHVRIRADGRLWFSPEFPARWKRLISVTTCLLIVNNQAPLDETAIRCKSALYQDYSNESLIRMGADLPRFTPEQAAGILDRAAAAFDLTLYEYFQTDIFGHRRSFQEAAELIGALDRLVGSLISRLDPSLDTLVLTSDHGNIEDFSTRGHTANPVPFLAWGFHGAALRRRVNAISDVTGAIVEVLAGR